jgi:hypothetical protein
MLVERRYRSNDNVDQSGISDGRVARSSTPLLVGQSYTTPEAALIIVSFKVLLALTMIIFYYSRMTIRFPLLLA